MTATKQTEPNPTSEFSTRSRVVQTFDSVQEQVGRAKKAAGTLGTVQGVLVDFLSPIGPITLIATVLFSIITGVSGYIWFGKERRELHNKLNGGSLGVEEFNQKIAASKWVSIFSYSLIATAILIFFLVGGAFGKEKRGLIAGTIPGLQSLQNDILGLKKDVKQLKQDVGALKRAGGLILTPKTAREHHHNARLYVQRNERSKARKSFEKAIQMNSELIDVHTDYQALLKDMEGISGTRKIYTQMAHKTKGSWGIRYASSLLQEDKERVRQLQAIVRSKPDYIPAIAQLCKEFSAAQLGGNSTIHERKQESMYLALFNKHNMNNAYNRYFSRSQQANRITQQLQSQYKMYTKSGALSHMIKNPVTIQARAITPGVYSVTILITGGIAQEIWYKLSEDAEFQSTGSMGSINPMTGKAYPKMFFMTRKLRVGENTIWVKFKDTKGIVSSIHRKTFKIKSLQNTQADNFVRYQWSNPLIRRIAVKYIGSRYMIMFTFAHSPGQFKWIRYSWSRPTLRNTLIRNGRGRNMFFTRQRATKRDLFVQFQLKSGWKSKRIRYPLRFTRNRTLKFFHPVD